MVRWATLQDEAFWISLFILFFPALSWRILSHVEWWISINLCNINNAMSRRRQKIVCTYKCVENYVILIPIRYVPSADFCWWSFEVLLWSCVWFCRSSSLVCWHPYRLGHCAVSRSFEDQGVFWFLGFSGSSFLFYFFLVILGGGGRDIYGVSDPRDRTRSLLVPGALLQG